MRQQERIGIDDSERQVHQIRSLRSRSASELFSKSVRRFMISSNGLSTQLDEIRGSRHEQSGRVQSRLANSER